MPVGTALSNAPTTAPLTGGDVANPGVGSGNFFAPPAKQAAREAALQIVTNPPQIGLTQPGLPPAAPAAPPPPPLPGQPATAPPAGLPDDQPGHEIETFHDAMQDQDAAEEGIGGGDGEPAVIPGAIPQAPAGGPPPPPPPPPSGWHPGMRVLDAQHMPGMAPVPVIDQIAALSEGAAINNPTFTNAPSGFPSAAGVVPSVGFGATAATNAMLAAVLEINTSQQMRAVGDSPSSSTGDLSAAVQTSLGIPPPPPPPMMRAHPVPNQFAQNLAAENGAFSGSAASGRMDPQAALLNAVRAGGNLKPAGNRKPYDRPPPKKALSEKEQAVQARQEMLAGIAGGVKLKPTQTRVAGGDAERVETEYGWKILKSNQGGPLKGIAADMDAELRRRRAAIDPDNEDAQGDQMMDDASESGWSASPARSVSMEDGMGVGMDANVRADMVNVGAAAALAGRARRGTGSPFGAVPDFSSDTAFMAGKYDQLVPDEDAPVLPDPEAGGGLGSRNFVLDPAPARPKPTHPGNKGPGKGNSKADKEARAAAANKPKAKNPPKKPKPGS